MSTVGSMDKVDGTAAHLSSIIDNIEPDAASYLVVILDLHYEGWQTRSHVQFWDMMPSLLVLLNAHLALDSSNELAMIGYNGAGTELIYSSTDSASHNAQDHGTKSSGMEGTMIPQFHTVDWLVTESVKSLIAKAGNTSRTSSIAGALSLCLAYLNRKLTQSSSNLRGHILVVSAEADNVGSKYIPAMNSIFSAQKLRVPIDVANFGPAKSFLQQAADFTGGSFLNLTSTGGLVETFLSVFAVDPCVRQYINLPTDPSVNFSAVCFISKKIVEIGYVCSVCLCIMEAVPDSKSCPVCKTNYEQLQA